MSTCSRCLLPIHQGETVDYLGDRVAHRHPRCVELLRMKITEMEALVEKQRRRAEDAIDFIRGQANQGTKYVSTQGDYRA
jgi:hypothetical protein